MYTHSYILNNTCTLHQKKERQQVSHHTFLYAINLLIKEYMCPGPSENQTVTVCGMQDTAVYILQYALGKNQGNLGYEMHARCWWTSKTDILTMKLCENNIYCNLNLLYIKFACIFKNLMVHWNNIILCNHVSCFAFCFEPNCWLPL
jgi:hypothetical protein